MRVAGLVTFLLFSVSGISQLSERPGGSMDNPIDAPRDLSGLSIKSPRLRLVHTTDPRIEGGSMWLQQNDPWLAYQWGRHLFQREFRERDGVYGDAGKLEGMRLPDGATKIASRSHVNSCAVCHSHPYRDAGAGSTIAKNGGTGRNTPHLFGAGLIEMLGQQLRRDLTAQADANHDGWISIREARETSAAITPVADAETLDFGRFDDVDGNGRPDLNDVVWPIYCDADGRRLPTAASLRDPDVAGYRLDVQVFGFGHLHAPNRPPIASTLRTFAGNTFDLHLGMPPCDPTCLDEDGATGFSKPSNAGCAHPMSQPPRDRGARRTPLGLSRDDPDRDGYCHEITEGEMDVSEWFALNHPRPGLGEVTDASRAGAARFLAAGCARCHVPDWHLRDDRRFFDLAVEWSDRAQRLEGRLTPLTRQQRGRHVPRLGSFDIKGLYSDLRYHEMGDDFAQVQYDGTVVRRWRTTPLWGAASTPPYGHDGASLTLHDVILRHGGEARTARDAYAALTRPAQREMLAFLETLTLYQTDQVPCDIDGDGVIEDRFMVAGQDTGSERLNPEWLFRTPGRIEGPVLNTRGERLISFALTNVREAYALDRPLLRDTDGDTFPDALDAAPGHPGFRDGER